MEKTFSYIKIPLVISVGLSALVSSGLAFSTDPLPGAVTINQDLVNPTMPNWEGDSASAVCIDDGSGLLVAGCDAATGTIGPEGPPGPPGPGIESDLVYTVVVPPVAPGEALASCDPDDVLLGGGVTCGASGMVKYSKPYPPDPGKIWSALCVEPSGTISTLTGATAICYDVGGDHM